MYDPTRDLYYLSYQWHPQHINWGNISWGQATSKDLIHWEDHVGWEDAEARTLGPAGNGTYNGLGIFSGTAQPVNLQGKTDGTLLNFYTSVSRLPTSWTLPYLLGTESQSLAYSTDGGLTYKEYENNPVISATANTAPMYWNITGFRDPFFETLPELDAALGASEPQYYAVFGSGIHGVGPRIPLWSAPASDLTKWTFLGALWEPAANTSLGPVLSTGSYGFNFEVSGFFALHDSKGKPHWYVNMGTEGGNVSFHESNHWALWNEGTISRRTNGSAAFTPVSGGAGDWGNAYALTSFNDTKHNRRVQWGWAPEDTADGGLFAMQQQGFQGSITLPRELFVHEVDNVINTAALSASKNAVFSGSTAQTLGVKPLHDVVDGLRQGSTCKSFAAASYSGSKILQQQASSHMELKVSIDSFTGAAGVIVAASPDLSERTTIMYEPKNNTILVERLHSSKIVEFSNVTVTGYFQPYTLAQKNGKNNQTESIVMDIFVDGSLVEVYVNDRFALTTRIYPSMQCSTGYGVYVADGAQAKFGSIEAWTGLTNAWPQRPANSSSPLVFDTAAETNNGVWWPGN